MENVVVQKEARSIRRPLLREGLIALGVALVIAALGVPVGLVWRAVSPQVELVRVGGSWYSVEESPEGYIADDGWFAVIGFGVGIAVALVVWFLLRKRRGPILLLAVTVGSLGGAALAAWLGQRIGLSAYHKEIASAISGTRLGRLAEIRNDVVLLSQTLAAVATYTLLAAFHYSPTLQNDDLTDDVEQKNSVTTSGLSDS